MKEGNRLLLLLLLLRRLLLLLFSSCGGVVSTYVTYVSLSFSLYLCLLLLPPTLLTCVCVCVCDCLSLLACLFRFWLFLFLRFRGEDFHCCPFALLLLRFGGVFLHLGTKTHSHERDSTQTHKRTHAALVFGKLLLLRCCFIAL